MELWWQLTVPCIYEGIFLFLKWDRLKYLRMFWAQYFILTILISLQFSLNVSFLLSVFYPSSKAPWFIDSTPSHTPSAPYSMFHSSYLDSVPTGTLFLMRRIESIKSMYLILLTWRNQNINRWRHFKEHHLDKYCIHTVKHGLLLPLPCELMSPFIMLLFT